MSNRERLLPTLFVMTLLAVAPACASQGGIFDRYPAPAQRIEGRAYRNGYDAGRLEGQEDARRGRRFDYNKSRTYRSASRGYDRGYGNREDYRRAFRQGFAAGYDDGYRRFARDDRYGRPDIDRRGPDRRNGPGGRGGAVSRSAATDAGNRDGYEQGRADARSGDRYDPVRAKRYREGDRGYNSRYGSRDDYKRDYRNAFQQGYDRGYREVRR